MKSIIKGIIIVLMINIAFCCSFKESDEIEGFDMNELFKSKNPIEYLNSFEKANKDSDYLKMLKAFTYFNYRNYKPISEILDNSIFKDSTYYYLTISFQYLCQEDFKQVEKYLNLASSSDINKGNYWVNYCKALMFDAMDELDTAKTLFEKLTKTNDNPFIMESLVQLYSQNNDIADSNNFKTLIEKISKVHHNYFYYYALGVYELLIAKNIEQPEKEKKLSECVKYLLKSIEDNKYYILSYVYLMKMYISEKKYTEAINIIQKSLQVLPNDTGFLTNLGDVYYYLGNYVKADSVFDVVLNLKPDDGDVIMKSIYLKIKLESYSKVGELFELYCKYWVCDYYGLETYRIILDIKEGKDVKERIKTYLEKYNDIPDYRSFLIQIMKEQEIDYTKYLDN